MTAELAPGQQQRRAHAASMAGLYTRGQLW
jgi:hypothetical protein